MESFWTYFKRHGFMLWLANLLGNLTVTTIIICFYIMIAIIGFILGLGVLAASFSSFDNLISQATYLPIGITIVTIIFGLMILLLSIFGIAFQTAGQYATANEAFNNERVRIRTYFVKGLRFIWRFTLQMLLMGLIQLPTILLWVVAIVLFNFTEDVGIFFGILLMIFSIVLFIATGLSCLLAPFIMIAEQMRPWQALVYSFRIFRQNSGKVMVIALLMIATGLIYGLISFMLYLPLIFSLIDPTGILASIILFILYIIQWVYNIAATPLLFTIISLIVAYHYYKYFRPQLFPQGSEEKVSDPTFAIKSDM